MRHLRNYDMEKEVALLFLFFQRLFLKMHRYNIKRHISVQGFLGGSVVKNLPDNVGDVGSIPGSGRSPEEGNGNPLQYSCLGNSMDRGAWWATVLGVTKLSDTL